MKASVTYTRPASEKAKEALKTINKEIEERKYVFHLNIYCVPEISAEADGFVKEAISKLDNSMKGWKPVANGTETQYDIYNKPELQYSYTRYYEK